MPELLDTFTSLRAKYAAIWPVSHHAAPNRTILMTTFTRPHWRGVYIIYRKEQEEPLYVGSAGKLERSSSGPVVKGQTVRSRLFFSNTPYFFDPATHLWRYGPTTSGAPPAGYRAFVPIPDLRIESFHLPKTHAASSLEHLLLQGCVNEFGNLPVANQRF